jgi:nicotinic acid mononucleotide adenylyltransferase
MRFLRRPQKQSRCIAVFCGAFHPPTVAHVELARSARSVVDEVLWVMPQQFPHKTYDQVALPSRLRLILEATNDAVAISSESLFFNIAAEAAQHLNSPAIHLLIGEDGARRIVDWDYGFDPPTHRAYLENNLRQFPILTARRQEHWQVPAIYSPWFHWLDVDDKVASISSSMVREHIAEAKPWRHLVPPTIEHRVAELYGSVAKFNGQ